MLNARRWWLAAIMVLTIVLPMVRTASAQPIRNARRQGLAPALTGGIEWLNCDGEINIKDLRGKVVLLDFWTYCCSNCLHVLPALEQLEEKYADELVIIGVHSGKFATEKDTDSIRQAVLRYHIRHPIVNDADYKIWNRYRVKAWPTMFIIDPEGYVVAGGGGEQSFRSLDRVIGPLIRQFRRAGRLKPAPSKYKLEADAVDPSPLWFPGKILADSSSQRLFIADSGHRRVVIASFDGTVQDVIGTGEQGDTDGAYDEATFSDPQGLALIGSVLYVADRKNHRIRAIDLRKKTVRSVAGNGRQAKNGARGGRATQTSLASPWDLLAVRDRILVAMAGLHQLWIYDPDKGSIAVLSGSGREDVTDGRGTSATHAQPSGLATDGNSLFVAESEGSAIRTVQLKKSPSVSTLVGPSGLPNAQTLFQFGDRDGRAGAVRLQHPLGLAYYRGILYAADTYNHKVKRIDPQTRTAITWLGTGRPGSKNSPTQLSEPSGLSAADGRLFIADTNNHAIRVADIKTGKLTTLTLTGLEPPVAVAKQP